jgi:hypothetical protein
MTTGDPNVVANSAPAVRQSVHVELAPSEAFRLFTDGIGEWWPLAGGLLVRGRPRAQHLFRTGCRRPLLRTLCRR